MQQSKIAIVTGGSRGIGRAIALHLADAGTDVIIVYRTHRAEAEAVVEAITARGRLARAIQHDVGDIECLPTFVEQIGVMLRETWDRETFDFLVNNAGIAVATPFVDTTVAMFDDMLNVLFRGVFFLTQQLTPKLADDGRIVNITGGLTRFTGPPTAAYASMKGAVEVLSRHLAAELGPRGITVNVIAPGPTLTDLGTDGTVQWGEQLRAKLASQSVFGRIGRPDDIGGAVAALLSDANAWVTGQRIEVSGGVHL